MNSLLSLLEKPDCRQLFRGLGISFCLLFLYTFFTALYDTIPDQTLRYIFHNHFVVLCVKAIHLISSSTDVIAIQNSIIANHVNLEMVRTCDGSTAFFLLVSAILAFRAPLKLTLMGLIIGLLLIMSFNVLRIVLMYFLIIYDYTWFSYFHLSIAPFLLLSTSCGYFAIWAYQANEVKHGRP